MKLAMVGPYVRPSLGGYKWVTTLIQRIYPQSVLCPQDFQDVKMASLERGYSAYKSGAEEEEIFKEAKRAALNEWRKWIYPRTAWWYTQGNRHEEIEPLPILPIARLIYVKLRKKGRRGMRSAVLKAYILQQRLIGKSSKAIAISLEISNHPTTVHSIKKHYQSATGLIFDINRGNIER